MKSRIAMVLGVSVLFVLMAGCATCRFSLVDIDLRSPEQIEASQVEAMAPYMHTGVAGTNALPEVVQTKSLPVSVWTGIMDVLKVLKFRLRIITIEWDQP